MDNEAIKILLVDSKTKNIKLINRLLEEESSTKIRCSATITGLFENIKEYIPDIILLDPYVDNGRGFDVFKLLQMEDIQIPVITLVDFKDQQTGKKALMMGAQDYISPENISKETLLHSIECAIERFEKIRPLLNIEEKYNITIRHSPIILYKQNRDLVYTWVDSSFNEINSSNIVGKKDSDIFPIEESLILTELKKKVLESGIETRKVVKLNIRGNPTYYDMKIEPYFNSSGEIQGIKGASLDITERKKVEREFLRAKNLLEKIFSSLNEAVLVYELSSRKIITCNPAVQKTFGYSAQELIGKSTEILHVSTDDFEKYRAKSDEILLKKGIYLTEYKMKRKDGRIIDTEHRITLLKKSKGWDEMVVAIINDTTARKQIENALISAKKNAEKSDQLKTEFLAQMSHEIRTPINIILSNASQIKEEFRDKLSDELSMSFRAIDRAGKRIIRTIDLLLNMSAMLTGNYESRDGKVDLYLDVLLNLYLEFKKQALDKNIEMNIYRFTDKTELVCDEYSINQIFMQLIDNAVKYTTSGKIEIKVLRNAEDKLTVEIEDTGIGISREYMEKLFSPFSQEDQGYTRSFEGTGLGLALVKKYSELNSAEIKVDSSKDIGSKFSVIFTQS